MIHRKTHQEFKVYLSFSERRIPQMSQYISDYLKHAFWLFNIQYYDFREHERFHFSNWISICELIDSNLVNSDIFLRFIDRGFEPNRFHSLAEDAYGLFSSHDYAKYEIDVSYDRFGFTNHHNRFQVVPVEIMVTSYGHITTIFRGLYESPLEITLKIIDELSHGYQEQQYWRMRDQMIDSSEGEGE
jgi:hypothetical protein